jgi:hypothetical protein
MASFSRKTILAVTDILATWGHSDLDRFLLEHGLEEAGLAGGSRQARANDIARYLLRNPEITRDDGRNLTDAIVEHVIQGAISNCIRYSAFEYAHFQEQYGPLV